jgi:hypothetical protein
VKRLIVIALVACGGPTAAPIEDLQNPETCRECHEQHYQQWAGSMHAYASEDPVFVAMNNRGQRETNNALGDFCVRCHAPMAVLLDGETGIDFDPARLRPETKGITCYFCHNVANVEDTHNNGLVIALDQTMRGGLKNAVENSVHFSKFDPLMDSDNNQSEMCGSCHDIVVPQRINGVADIAVERTFAEWQQTFLATDENEFNRLSCGACHMVSKDDLVADAPGLGTTSRPLGFHSHTFPGVDQALTPFPGIEEQKREIEEFLAISIGVRGPRRLGENFPSNGGICLTPQNLLQVRVDNINSGHAWPSGAAQDRRAWLEVRAFDDTGAVVFESGITPADMDPADTELTPVDQEVVVPPGGTFGMWDRTFKQDGTPAHFFWEVTDSDPDMLLPVPIVRDGDHSLTASFQLPGAVIVDRIETRIVMRALPYELIDDLVATGDLAPGIRDQLQTIVVGGESSGTGGNSVWTLATRDDASRCNPYPPPP